MSNKKNTNIIDNLVDTIAETVLKGKGAEHLLNNPESLRFLDFFLRHIIDLQSYVGLFKMHYLPAANRSTFEAKKQISSSKYKTLFNFTEEDIKENIHETIRLGYVGLYHKLESFVEGLGKQRKVIKETYLEDDEENKFDDVFKYLLAEFGLLRTDFKKDINPRITRLRLICNKVKHDDGYIIGVNDALLNHMPGLIFDNERRIRIPAEIFFKDCEYIKDFFKDVFQLINFVSVYYFFTKGSFSKTQEGKEAIDKLKDAIGKMIELMRQ